MRSVHRCVVALVLASILLAVSVEPAGSQDTPLVLDPAEGLPGDEIVAVLDPAVIASTCITEVADLQARLRGVAATISDQSVSLGLDGDELVAAETLSLLFNVLAIEVEFAEPGPMDAAEKVLDNLFVLGFEGEWASSLDAETGVGTLTVPALPPGEWTVTASCVFPDFTRSGPYLEAVSAAASVLQDYLGTSPIDRSEVLFALLSDSELAEDLFAVSFRLTVAPLPGAIWDATFTISASGPVDLPGPPTSPPVVEEGPPAPPVNKPSPPREDLVPLPPAAPRPPPSPPADPVPSPPRYLG